MMNVSAFTVLFCCWTRRLTKSHCFSEQVGTTANGRHIWRWTGPAIDQPAPVELIFTNHDLLPQAMPFANSGYYNYDHLIYKASQTSPASISSPANSQTEHNNTYWYTLDGKLLPTRPSKKGVYIHQGKIRYLGTK